MHFEVVTIFQLFGSGSQPMCPLLSDSSSSMAALDRDGRCSKLCGAHHSDTSDSGVTDSFINRGIA